MAEKEEWNSIDVIHHHILMDEVLIPGCKETLSIVARLATEFTYNEPRIMDIGCGYGDVTAEILEFNPLASVCMVDYSEEMLKLSKERFGDNKRIKAFKYDLSDGIPDELGSSRFDAVVSCYSLHHIEHENKMGLYTQIRQVLDEGGLFINGDRFSGESPVIGEWEFDNWITWMTGQINNKLAIDRTFDQVKERQIDFDRRLGDKPGTLRDTERDLKQSGFQYVDCVWKNHNIAIVTATDR